MASTNSRWRTRLGSLLLLVAGFAVSALVGELAVSLIAGPQVRFPRHVVSAPWGLRFNEPGSRYRHRSADVDVAFRINAQGMRADRDYAYAKPAGVKRIVSLGDSFTVGYEVEVEETFSAVLEAELRDRGHAVEVLNAGVSGFSTAEELAYLERELWRYEPDLVVVSFYTNDILDNVRSNLFALDGERVVPVAERYVPAGSLGDLLNSNPLLAFLSERSNAFALTKEGINGIVKQRLVEANRSQLREASPGVEEEAAVGYEERLAAALLDELHRRTRARGVPLVVQNIPHYMRHPSRLLQSFPRGFDKQREGLAFLDTQPLLDPFVDTEPLYNVRSHWHWTPFAHRISGRGLARIIHEQRLLGESGTGA